LPEKIQANAEPKYCMIKKRRARSFIVHKSKVFFALPLPWKKFFDPTGPVDTFCGGGFAGYCRIGKHKLNNLKALFIHGSNLASFGLNGLEQKNGKIRKERS